MALAGGFLLGSLAFGSGIEYAAGALVGIMLTPDLDVDRGYIGNTILRNRIGAWAERGWSLLWGIYRSSVKHGSPLSHFPIVSTLARITYLFFFLVVVPYIGLEVFAPRAWDIGYEIRWWFHQLVEHYRIILGLMGSDLIHYTLDVLTTEHAKQKKQMIFGMPLASSMCR